MFISLRPFFAPLFLVMMLSLPKPSAGEEAFQRVTLMTDFTPLSIYGPLFLPLVKGWFRDAGIEIDIQDGKGSGNTIRLVGAGQIDMGYINVGALIAAREGGIKVISVAGFVRKSDLGLEYDPKAGIRSPNDLVGKKVAFFSGGVVTPYIPIFFAAIRVDPKSVNLVNVDSTAMYSAFMAGRVDGIMTQIAVGLPLVDAVRPARAFLAADYGVDLPGHGLVVNETTFQSRRATFAKVVSIIGRAWDYVRNGHEEEAIEAVMTARPEAKLDLEVSKKQLVLYGPYLETENTKGKPLGWQSDRDWMKIIDTAERAGVIKGGHKPEEYYTNMLIDSVH